MLGNHEKGILQFSGGKDSLALLYLARPYLDRIIVMFGDTGAVYPHLVEFVHETCERLGAELMVVKPEILVQEQTERFGYPSDIVPTWVTPEIEWILRDKPKQLLQHTMSCCLANLLLPMQKAFMESDATILFRGAKKADARRGIPPGTWIEGKEYDAPLWDWTDEDVFDYLKKEGVEPASHYSEAKDSLDCWLCTAHIPFGDARPKLEYTKKHYPELWPELQRRLRVVHETVATETAKVNSVLEDFLDG